MSAPTLRTDRPRSDTASLASRIASPPAWLLEVLKWLIARIARHPLRTRLSLRSPITRTGLAAFTIIRRTVFQPFGKVLLFIILPTVDAVKITEIDRLVIAATIHTGLRPFSILDFSLEVTSFRSDLVSRHIVSRQRWEWHPLAIDNVGSRHARGHVVRCTVVFVRVLIVLLLLTRPVVVPSVLVNGEGGSVD